jgi:hypothetical protein
VVGNVTKPPPGFSERIVHSLAEATPVLKSYASAATSLASVATTLPVTPPPSATLAFFSRPLGAIPAFSLEESKEMIRNAFLRAPDASRIGGGCLKSFVGNFLKQNHDKRFPDREDVKEFFAFAIEHGIVMESGNGEYKLLTLPGTAPSANIRYSSPIIESTIPPIPVALMPKRALEAASISPFVIFIPWSQCPSKSDLPKWTFVQSATGVVCDSCYVFSEEDAAEAEIRVCELLEVMAENDDIYVTESQLRKLLYRRYNDSCASRKQAALWITSSINDGLAVLFKKDKNKCVCLSRNFREAALPFPPEDLDTSAEEAHVVDLLWESHGAWLGRAVAGQSLAAKFDRMSKAYMRNRVFLNAHSRKRIFVAKSEYGHTVALTEQVANDALRFLLPPSLVAKTPDTESVWSVADGIGVSSNPSSDDDSSD